MKKVLIPTLRFPPAGGVGIRRIIKMGKELSRLDVQVHYVTTCNARQVNSYADDVKSERIIINIIPSLSLNNYLNKHRDGFGEKVFAKFLYWVTKPLFFIDYATLWGIVLVPYVYKYVKANDIKNIYVSGAPFSTVFYMTILKRYMNDVNLISEWRDLWTDILAPTVLSRFAQKNMERFCIKTADYVIGVTKMLLNNLLLKTDTDKRKFILIENGFDKEDFDTNLPKKKNEKIRIVYTGNIVDTRLEGLRLFLDFLKKKYAEGKIQFELCGEISYKVKRTLQKYYATLLNNGTIKYHGIVSVEESTSLIQHSDFGLVLVQRDHPEALTSKFFEYCAVKKPVIAIGPCGELHNKMQKNYVGIYCELDNFSTDELYSFINMGLNGKEFCFDRILKENDFSNLAKTVESILK